MATQDARKEVPEGSQDPGFDARLGRLEELVGELEDGELPLEGAIERYRAGVRLLAECREILTGYRRQVEELTREAAEELRPYEDDPDAPAGRSRDR